MHDTPANASVRATPGKMGQRPWGWVEIHWAGPRTGVIADDFALDKYECPILNEYSIGPEGKAKASAVDAMPEKYRDKALTEIYEEFSKAGCKAGINLHKELVNHADKFIKNNGVICRDVTQWVIVEIQPLYALEKVFSDALPFFDIWGFLQPRGIGDREAMKRDNGWVTDDAPRAGWFHAQIAWHRDMRRKQGRPSKNYIPRMHILSDPLDSEAGHKLDCRVTSMDSASLRRHPKRASYGKGKRILIRIPVRVANIASISDMRRRDELVAFAQERELTAEQQRRLLRFEVGSYLKVWVRNSTLPWDASEPPVDHPGSRCMVQMQALDRPGKHDNSRFRNIVTSHTCDVDSWEVDGYGKVSDYLTHLSNPDFEALAPQHTTDEGDVTAAQARLPSVEWLEAGKQTTPLLFEGEWFASDEQALAQEGDDASMPKWDEASETTYKCGSDTFRPFAFRNHTWKRNHLVKNEEGKLDQNEWVYVGLWPEELISAMESIPQLVVKDTHKGGALSLIMSAAIFAVANVIVYRLMEGLKKGATLQARGTKHTYKSADTKSYKFVKKILDTLDVPEMAAIIGCYGLPQPDDTNPNAPRAQEIARSYLKMRKEFQSKVEDKSDAGMEKFLYHIYGTIQELIIGAIDGRTLKNGVPTQEAYNHTFSKTPRAKKDWTWFEPNFKEIIDGKISAEALKGEYIRRLGGGPLPAPALCWMAWVTSFQMRCLASLSIEFSELMKAGSKTKKTVFEVSPSGEAGFFCDLGAAWTLAANLGVAFHGSPKQKDDFGEDYPEHAFGSTLAKLFEMVDLQLGAAAKFVLDGTFACSLDLDKIANGAKGFFEIESKTGATAKIEMPVTGKLSLLTKEFFSINCALLHLSTSALRIYPEGVRVSSEFGGWRGFNVGGKEIAFGAGSLDRYMLMQAPYEMVLGRPVKSHIASSDIIPNNEQVRGREVTGFATYIIAGSGMRIDVELVRSEYLASMRTGYRDGTDLFSVFALDVENLRTDAELRSLVRDILNDDTHVEFGCRIGDDRSRSRTLAGGQKVTIPSPRITAFRVVEGPLQPTLSQSVTYDMQISNLEQPDLPLYVWPVENDRVMGPLTRTPILNVEGSRGCMKVQPVRDSNFKGRYRFKVCLSNLSDMKRGFEPWRTLDSTWEVSFRVTIDPAGKYALRFSGNGVGEYSEELSVRRP